jgi:hypothetical protein
VTTDIVIDVQDVIVKVVTVRVYFDLTFSQRINLFFQKNNFSIEIKKNPFIPFNNLRYLRLLDAFEQDKDIKPKFKGMMQGGFELNVANMNGQSGALAKRLVTFLKAVKKVPLK